VSHAPVSLQPVDCTEVNVYELSNGSYIACACVLEGSSHFDSVGWYQMCISTIALASSWWSYLMELYLFDSLLT
jgi:hypothetical protein